MAKRITLRNNTSNNAGKGSKMSHAEMDANLETFFMSSSLDGNILRLYSTGSVNTDSIDLSGIVGSGNGTQGIQGVQGITGTGLQGIQGPAGEGGGSSAQGTQGIQGGQGEQGIQGPAGEGSGASAQGVQGIQGTEGTGIQGIQGTEGTGIQGIQGLAGDAAAQGIQGIQGTQGEQGIQGLTGEGSQGIQGPAGSGGGISSVTVNHLDLLDPFVVATSTLNFTGSGVTVTENPNGTAEIFIPSSAGAQGTSGAQGTQGTTGTGLQGIQGTSGVATSGTAYSVMYRDSAGDTTSGTTNLTYDTAFDELTITTPSTSQPQLVLKAGGTVTAGSMLGFINARNTNYASGGSTQTPGIRFVGDGTWTNGVTYPSKIEFLTAETNTATVKASLNKTGDLWVATDVSASGELYAGGTTVNNELNSYPLVINPGTGRIFYSTSGSVGNNVTRAVNGSDPLTINGTSTPALPELNGGHLIYMPQSATQSIKFGFAAGNWGNTSWNRDFYCTVMNVGTNGSTDNDWSMGIEMVTPNDGGGNFTVFTHGHQPDGTRRFQHNSVAANSGLVIPYDLQGGGVLNVYMDYATRVIVFNSSEFA